MLFGSKTRAPNSFWAFESSNPYLPDTKVKMAKDAPKTKGRDGRKKVDKKTHVTREYTINFGKQLKGR